MVRIKKKRFNKYSYYRAVRYAPYTPKWANLDAIDAIYAQCRKMNLEHYKKNNIKGRKKRLRNVKYNVDHIIPLNGKFVCGLHVETNLRIVTRVINLSKSNKLIDELT